MEINAIVLKISAGNTINFMLSAERDERAAKRFFSKALKASQSSSSRVINLDKNAAYPPAIDELKAAEILAQSKQLRQNKYLNNIVEQGHKFIKKLVNKSLSFQSFYTARRTIKSYETLNRIKKGQIIGIEKGDIEAFIEFVYQIFGAVV